ncbi:MAG: hypothetical protein FJX34_02530 [Alphaproteobacteria bacterium]|nr:hypothetical protein [Alphaproteobacteria bacterium]
MRFFLVFSLFCGSAFAQVIDSSFFDWTVYEMQANELEPKTCYIISHPTGSNSNHNSREKPYLMITRFQQGRSEEVSIFGGFEYKLNSKIFVLVGDKQYHMKTKGDMAWNQSKFADVGMIESMLNGALVKVRSDSAIGTYAIDEYSLKGVTRAYVRMREICK